MKKVFILIICLLFSKQTILAQDDWMNSLYAAKRLALAQDKMLLMIWEEAIYFKLPVFITDGEDNDVVIDNLFDSPEINALLWDNFVLVKVSETEYPTWYEALRKSRSLGYLNKLGDNSIKVMDANGNILNAGYDDDYVLDLIKLLNKYALNTSYLKQELINYRNDKNFYTSFYLASKYIDYAFYVNKEVRPEIVDLSNIYLNEAKNFLEVEELDNKSDLLQRIELLEIEQFLVVNQPKKVLRKLKRIEESQIQGANNQLYAFLYFVAYRLLLDEEKASAWRPKISLVDLEKAKYIMNNN